MSAADVDIANAGLASIGCEAITSFDDNNPRSRACKRQYPLSRDAELRAHRWNFAMKRASLPALSTPPVWGYANAYLIPLDCMRMDQVGDWFVSASLTDYRSMTDADFALEGGQILTDLTAPLDVRYVAQITQTGRFDPSFVMALAARLAMDLCMILTNSETKKQSAERDYQRYIAEAVAVNAIEKSPEPLPDDSWILGRI